MRFLDWLTGKRRSRAGHRSTVRQRHSQTGQRLLALEETATGIKNEIGTMCILLKRHEDQLAQHQEKLGDHTARLETLVRSANAVPAAQPSPLAAYASPLSQSGPAVHPRPIPHEPAGRFDVDHFTGQQKRILGVFFQDKGRRMSYVEVAALLGKSAHTVKNQINQIRQKADLFEQVIGPENRNLFKLKDDVRVEKYLNCGQPAERPAPTPWPAQSSSPQ